MISGRTFRTAVFSIALLIGGLTTRIAYASIITLGVATAQGAGVGVSNVVLTVQKNPTESGCVSWNGTTDVVGSAACAGGLSPAIPGGDEKTGVGQTQTRTVLQTGVLSGSSLIVVLNVGEPSGTLFTVENLSLTIYSPAGSILYNTGNLVGAGVPPGGGITLNSSDQGVGTLGFAFGLDATQAVVINPFLSNPNNRFGLSALLTNVAGSNETFFIADSANVSTTPPAPVPEPSTFVLLASGVLGVLGNSKRKLLRVVRR